MPNRGAVRIVVADDHCFFRSGFITVLGNHYPDKLVFLEDVGDGNELILAVDRHRPDIVITDIQMPIMNGIEACRRINERYPDIPVIALSMFTDTENVVEMIQAGAKGYLSKNSSHEEIYEAILTVNEDQSYYCSTVSSKMFAIVANSNQANRKIKRPTFGKQEISVIKLICRQMSTKQIASEMGLAPKTVEHYRERIQEKIGAKNVVGIALYAFINRIV